MAESDAGVPVWLLDIDGVVNVNADRPDRRIWPEWVTAEVANPNGIVYPMLAATAVIDFLARVHEQGAAEIRWHTTWQQGALAVGEALGLPRFVVQRIPQPATTNPDRDPNWDTSVNSSFGAGWWKYPVAEHVVHEEGRRLIWTDDDASIRLGPAEQERLEGSLVVAPTMEVGLTRDDLDRIAEYCGLEPA